MRVLADSFCFCKRVSKSERMKGAIFSGKGPAMAMISATGNGSSRGTGFLIHRNLLLTTHVNLPSIATAESAEIRLQNGIAASLFPHRFFITSSVLDLTIVGLDPIDGDSNGPIQQPQYLTTCSKPNLNLGSVVYLLGHTDKNELAVGEGKLVVATDSLVKLSISEMGWRPGSAGFDVQGNLAFMICDPMKMATSPNTTKSASTSSSSSTSWKKDVQTQFGIPVPVIIDWLNQHWEGNLDELTKPKLPIIRLMSSGQKSEHSCASFTRRRVFKPSEADNDGTPCSSNALSKTKEKTGPSSSAAVNRTEEETQKSDQHNTHVQGIPTPEIYESPKLTSVPLRTKETGPVQLLDINFPPRITRASISPSLPGTVPPSSSNEKPAREQNTAKSPGEEIQRKHTTKATSPEEADREVDSTGSTNGARDEVMSSSSPLAVQDVRYGYSSEEETMYSAETAESRNYTSPRENRFQQAVGRSQSCVSCNRWGSTDQKSSNSNARRMMLEKQRIIVHGKKVYSQGATSQRSNDYFSPTVSSIMKKRSDSPRRPQQQRAVHSSPRWMF